MRKEKERKRDLTKIVESRGSGVGELLLSGKSVC
jgi:hypothetical protein